MDIHEKFKYNIFDLYLILDVLYLAVIIIPLFGLSLKYLTASSLEPYTNKYNSLLAPIALIPMFFFSNYDILFLSILVFIMNLYVAWRQIDDDEYNWASYYSDEAMKEINTGQGSFSGFADTMNQMALHDPLTFGMRGSMLR